MDTPTYHAEAIDKSLTWTRLFKLILEKLIELGLLTPYLSLLLKMLRTFSFLYMRVQSIIKADKLP